MRKTALFACVLALAVLAAPALGQKPSDKKYRYDDSPAWRFDARVGVTRINGIAVEGNKFSIGFEFAKYPFRFAKIADRMSIGFGADFAFPLTEWGYSGEQYKERVYALGANVGFDAYRGKRLTVTPHVGASWIIDRFTVGVPSSYYYQGYSLCDEPDFEGVCEMRTNVLGKIGVGIRYTPFEGAKWFSVLFDPSRFAGGYREFKGGVSFTWGE